MHPIEYIDEALLNDLRQGLGDGPAVEVTMPNQLYVAGVGEFEAMLRASEHCHEARRLLKHLHELIAPSRDIAPSSPPSQILLRPNRFYARDKP